MKRVLLHSITILLSFILCTQVKSQVVKVAYATYDAEMDSSAVQPDNDPIIQLLQNDPNFTVDVIFVDKYGSVDISGYDLAIVQESITSVTESLKPGQGLGLASISVPFIYNKVYALRSGRALGNSSWSRALQDLDIKYLEVKPENQWNELFTGITFHENKFDVFRFAASYSGEINGDLGMQYVYDLDISTENTLLAYGSTELDKMICFNDIPAGTTVGGETLKSRMIAMGMYFGAIYADNGYNFTNEGLTLWRNAIYSLADIEIPQTVVFSDTKTDQLPPVTDIQALNKESYVDISWQYPYVDYIESFEIWKGTSPDNLAFYANTSTQNYKDNGVNIGDAFYYAIVIKSSMDDVISDPVLVNVQEIAPAKPVIGFYESHNKSIYMEWSVETTADLSHFRIYRGLDPENLTLIDSVDYASTSFEDTSVVNFTRYYYSISAVDSSFNESPLSDVINEYPINISPVIETFSDYVAHGISEVKVNLPFSLDESHDPDGQLAAFEWYVNGQKASASQNPILSMGQGTNTIDVFIEDNDGAKDSTSFKIFIDAGYYSFNASVDKNAGISAISDNYIYVPERDGKMQILDGNFQEVLDVSVPGDISSVSSISTDTIMYLSSSTKTIYCFDKLGIPKWSLPLGGDLEATPTIDMKRDRIYMGVSNNNLFGINRSSGVVEWLYKSSGSITQPGVILGSDSLLVIAGFGEVLLFNLDGKIEDSQLQPISTFSLDTFIVSAPAVDKDKNIYVSSVGGCLMKFRFNASGSGELSWSKYLNTTPHISPIIGKNGTIYIGANDGRFYAINPESGSEEWSVELDGKISSTATLNEADRLYVGTSNGTMYGLTESGIEVWKYETGFSIANATFYEKQHLYFSNAAGQLYKILDPKVEVVIISKSATLSNEPQWGTYLGNSRRSGVQVESYSVLLAEESLIENIQSVSSFPNPFVDFFQLNYTLKSNSDVKFRVYNAEGKTMKSIDLGQRTAGQQQHTLQLNNLPQGIYYYQLQTNDNFVSGKIVKR